MPARFKKRGFFEDFDDTRPYSGFEVALWNAACATERREPTGYGASGDPAFTHIQVLPREGIVYGSDKYVAVEARFGKDPGGCDPFLISVAALKAVWESKIGMNGISLKVSNQGETYVQCSDSIRIFAARDVKFLPLSKIFDPIFGDDMVVCPMVVRPDMFRKLGRLYARGLNVETVRKLPKNDDRDCTNYNSYLRVTWPAGRAVVVGMRDDEAVGWRRR